MATYSRGKAWVGAEGKAGFKKDFSKKFNYSSNSTNTPTKKKKKTIIIPQLLNLKGVI